MIKQTAAIKVLLTFLTLCAGYQNMSAQQTATVKAFTQTTDHIPGANRQNDLNGNPCALVKIQVVDDVQRIEGNKIGEIINKGVEKWVYMCSGSRNMKIHLKNYLPVKINFQEYNVKELEGNRVYELVINTGTPAPINTKNVKGNYLRAKVFPKDAVFVIWGDNLPKRLERPQPDGTLKLFLPYERYHLRAEASGYHPEETSVFVNDENEVVDITLLPVMGQLFLKCPSKKADFYVNGVKMAKNTNSWLEDIPPGQYIVEARAKGYVPLLEIISVSAEKTTEVSFGNMTLEREKNTMSDEEAYKSANLRLSVIKERDLAIAKAESEQASAAAKAKALEKEYSYDRIYMLDGSHILCKVSDVRNEMILIKQKGNDNLMRIPVRQVDFIKYSNGEFERFK